MNTGDTVFMFVATVMVMLMTPGLALFMEVWFAVKRTQYDNA